MRDGGCKRQRKYSTSQVTINLIHFTYFFSNLFHNLFFLKLAEYNESAVGLKGFGFPYSLFLKSVLTSTWVRVSITKLEFNLLVETLSKLRREGCKKLQQYFTRQAARNPIYKNDSKFIPRNHFVKWAEYDESALGLCRMKGFPYYDEIFFFGNLADWNLACPSHNDFLELAEYSKSALKLYRMKGFPYCNEIFSRQWKSVWLEFGQFVIMILSNWQNMANLHLGCADWEGFHIFLASWKYVWLEFGLLHTMIRSNWQNIANLL